MHGVLFVNIFSQNNFDVGVTSDIIDLYGSAMAVDESMIPTISEETDIKRLRQLATSYKEEYKFQFGRAAELELSLAGWKLIARDSAIERERSAMSEINHYLECAKKLGGPNHKQKSKEQSSFAAPTLLEGWSVERRSYGVGQCFGGTGNVLCYGKWGVIGGTGRYRILHPSGWIEDSPKFTTELEAMLWVKAYGKPKPSNDQAQRPLADSDAGRKGNRE